MRSAGTYIEPDLSERRCEAAGLALAGGVDAEYGTSLGPDQATIVVSRGPTVATEGFYRDLSDHIDCELGMASSAAAPPLSHPEIDLPGVVEYRWLRSDDGRGRAIDLLLARRADLVICILLRLDLQIGRQPLDLGLLGAELLDAHDVIS
jgi:hypothetical protein